MPQAFYDRIKSEAADRHLSLSQYFQLLVAQRATSSEEIAHNKEAWKREGWVECAASILTAFRQQAFCNVDLVRLTAIMSSDPSLWEDILKVVRAHGHDLFEASENEA